MVRREHNNYGSGVTLNPIKIEDAAALLSCYYFMIVALLLFIGVGSLFLMFFLLSP